MENQNQKPAKKKPKQSKTSSTSKKKEPEPNPLEALQGMLAPLLGFHKAVEGATSNDLRLYWDVRLVRGEDTPFSHVKGTSSMPGMLEDGRLSEAPGLIQSEIMEKIGKTITSKLQKLSEDNASPKLDTLSIGMQDEEDYIEDTQEDLENPHAGDEAMKHAQD